METELIDLRAERNMMSLQVIILLLTSHINAHMIMLMPT